MRIISGKFKGRRFNPPLKKWPTRPTMDQAKEALFNILVNSYKLEEVSVLDLFGGTGSVSLEFISRGCNDLSYVDMFPACINYVGKLSRELQIENQIKLIRIDCMRFLKKTDSSFDLIFCDPPYDYPQYEDLIELVFQKEILSPEGMLIVEHDFHRDFSLLLNFIESRKYGNSHFSFFKAD